MRTLQLIHGEAGRKAQTGGRDSDFFSEKTGILVEKTVCEFPSRFSSEVRWDDTRSPRAVGQFFRQLSIEALSDFESLAVHSHCAGTAVLIKEEEEPSNIFFLLEGRVKLSINSVEGRRLILGIAGPGEILGLASAISGCPYEVTAEAYFPCRISSLDRDRFLNFLERYPIACQNVARELSLDSRRTFEQLRTLGLTLSAPAKLARLLLDWCAEGELTELGIRIQCALTHGEIGEHIGVSRETVTRSLNEFKSQGLVERRGTTLLVPSRTALAFYAGNR